MKPKTSALDHSAIPPKLSWMIYQSCQTGHHRKPKDRRWAVTAVCRPFFLCRHTPITGLAKHLFLLSTTMANIVEVLTKFYDKYSTTTPKRLKIIDAYLLYILLTGGIQFLYCLLVGTFPFNSFLAGFTSCVSSFVLAVCLRIQVNPENKSEFGSAISPERAFADFIFAHIILHLVVVNFMGWRCNKTSKFI